MKTIGHIRQNSILFFNPDYHCSFFLRNELRNRGWIADVSVSSLFPEQYLFESDVITFRIRPYFLEHLVRWVFAFRYKFVVHYGRVCWSDGSLAKPMDYAIWLWSRVMKLFGTTIFYLPSGCHDHISKEVWMKIDDGRVCGNCAERASCNDRYNNKNFALVRRIGAIGIGVDGHETTEFQEKWFRYKSLDLDIFKPGIEIPSQLRLEPISGIRILYKETSEHRRNQTGDIKGTNFIINSIEKLKQEGFDIETVKLSGVHISQVRYLQAQADIVVDQLIYGGAGSFALESLAMGKPVICYVRPSWKDFLATKFPEWEACPLVSATPDSLTDQLRKLVVDEDYRIDVGRKSRDFATKFLDVNNNVLEFEKVLNTNVVLKKDVVKGESA